ncbi:radical SAM/SPASM domain-containing protein [Rhizobium leguminosarum]|uniref:radical SAM/SPASM domain-containing protein n=1 Tax=Rhizobium leguminosarum TaxID=384 RepID=UPI001C9174CE|nr:radical SAM protein [Rhizobium leguminosarum]MBY3003817.1 radical SAM protein [Rhizobium leguminosarum]
MTKVVHSFSIEQLRQKQRLSKATSYIKPKDHDLSSDIVAGKKILDETTGFSVVEPSIECAQAPTAAVSGERYVVSSSSALPLYGPFSRRLIDGSFLWVDIARGRLVVLDDALDSIMLRLCHGAAPAAISNKDDLHKLIGLLARGDFIRGIKGHADSEIIDAKRFLRIHLTERCNLSCVHCYADSGPNLKADGELSEQRWRELISEFAQLGGKRVLFTGGEALAYAGCDRLLRHSKDLGLHVTLFTNGILVPKFLDAISDNVDEVQVSIDGASSSTNDPIRGGGSFHKAVRAIDLLAERGVSVRISTVAMKSNLEDIKGQYIEFASRWKDRPVTFKINYGILNHGRGTPLAGELDINQTRPIVDKLMADLNPHDTSRIVRSTSSCGYAEQIVVAPNGEVHPCHLLDGAIANLTTDSIASLLGKLEAEQSDYSVDESVGCKTCDIRHLCGGTCRVENGKRTGNRRVTYCDADEKLRKLIALKRTFS